MDPCTADWVARARSMLPVIQTSLCASATPESDRPRFCFREDLNRKRASRNITGLPIHEIDALNRTSPPLSTAPLSVLHDHRSLLLSGWKIIVAFPSQISGNIRIGRGEQKV